MLHIEQLKHLSVAVLPCRIIALGHLPPSSDFGLRRQKLVASIPELIRFPNRYR